MPFSNEFISTEEVEKLNLKEVWDKYKPRFKGEYWLGRQPDLTIDRDRNAFLMLLSYGDQYHPSWHYFLLSIDGRETSLILDLDKRSSTRLSDKPFKRVWKIVKLDIEDSGFREYVVNVLKDALVAYGYRGIHKKVDDIEVAFCF